MIIKKISQSLLFLFLLAGMMPVRGSAQTSTVSDEVKTLLEKVQRAYRQADHLSFRVNYVYANAGQPNQPTDSLKGVIQMDKDRCKVTIDNTETIVTGKYAIHIMNEDKSIYLSGKDQSSLPDLLNMTDSLLAHLQGLTVTAHQEGAYQVLTFLFPPKYMYSRISLSIDPVSGYLRQTTYALRTTELVGKEMIESPGHAAPYQSEGLITVYFSNYEHSRFADLLFDEHQIFTHVAGRYQPVGQYKDYHIFLASTNL